MNLLFVFVLVQFAATYARRFRGFPRNWAIKALEPKAPVHVYQERIQQKSRKRLWLKYNMIRY